MVKPAFQEHRETIKGNPINIREDVIEGNNFIIISDYDGKEILRVEKTVWSDKIAGFSAEIKYDIIEHCMKLYG